LGVIERLLEVMAGHLFFDRLLRRLETTAVISRAQREVDDANRGGGVEEARGAWHLGSNSDGKWGADGIA
jgi:hypothetical protein